MVRRRCESCSRRPLAKPSGQTGDFDIPLLGFSDKQCPLDGLESSNIIISEFLKCIALALVRGSESEEQDRAATCNHPNRLYQNADSDLMSKDQKSPAHRKSKCYNGRHK